jgi:VWFA-related protein
MTRPRAFAIILALVADLSAAMLAAQGDPQQPPRFRASVDLIQVDVSVLDRDKHAVRGLTAADFTLFENGRPQDIVAFAEVTVPAASTQPAAWLRSVPADVRSNAVGEGRLFAIVMDDATMPPDLRITANARKIARNIVARMGPDDQAAVIYVDDSRRSVEFTNDRARLVAAIDAFAPGFAFADTDPLTDSQHYFASIRTLGLVSAHLTHVPQRRKAVIYISTGVPVEPVKITRASLPSAAAPGQSAPVDVDTTMDESVEIDLNVAYSELLEDRPQEAYGAALQAALIRAQHGNVNIYSIDPAGLGGMESYLQSRTRVAPVGLALVTSDDATTQAHLSRDFLRAISESSGGQAILNTNDFEAGVTRVFEENSAYYLIGYESGPDAAKQGVRRVSVRMNHGGLNARTRNAYRSPSEAGAPGFARADSWPILSAALSGVMPNPAVTLRAAPAVFALPDGRTALAVTLGVEQRVPGDAGARVNEELAVLATAFSPDGKPRAWARQTLKVTLRAGLDPAAYEVISRLDLDPGRYQVRLAVRSAMTGKTGSVYFDVVAPAFVREALQLSGVALSASRPLTAVLGDGVASLLPVVPTSRRSFRQEDTVSGFLRVYQGGARSPGPVDVVFSVVDSQDRVMHRAANVIGPEAFAGGQADYQWILPMSGWRPGEYLLTVRATQGAKSVHRTLRFTVQ